MFFENLWKEISTLNEVQSIALAGSRASEKYDEKSDYDLYIYCDTVPNDSSRWKRMVEYAKDYGKILPKNFEENLTSLFSNIFSDKENTLLILENIVTEIKK